jgi:hypothetical protein
MGQIEQLGPYAILNLARSRCGLEHRMLAAHAQAHKGKPAPALAQQQAERGACRWTRWGVQRKATRGAFLKAVHGPPARKERLPMRGAAQAVYPLRVPAARCDIVGSIVGRDRFSGLRARPGRRF